MSEIEAKDPRWLDEAAEAAVVAYGDNHPIVTTEWSELGEYERQIARAQVRAVLAVARKHSFDWFDRGAE